MKKIFFILLGFLTLLFLTACGATLNLTQKQKSMIINKDTVYTSIPMWEENNKIYGTNYRFGTLIPINSPVRILSADIKAIVFVYQGERKTFYIMQRHTKVDTSVTIARTFSDTPVDFSKYSSEMQMNIKRAKITNGMSKGQVILTRGYPPYHQTNTLMQNTWKYWNSRRGTQKINFVKNIVVNRPGGYTPLVQRAVQIPKKETSNSEFPYTFVHTGVKQPDSFVLAIGINKYQQNPDVAYADKSALAFSELANKTMGVPKENIITLINEQATSGQLKAKIELIKELADSRGNLYIYFAGHGVPGKDGQTYILPYDMSADAIHLEQNLRLDKIYARLAKINVKKVFVVMDTCFSGKDDSGSLLYKGVAPVLRSKKIKVDKRKISVLTAGKSTDFANDLASKKQRMFTYYLIKELANGKRDLNSIYPDVQAKVKRASLRKGLGYKQIPQRYGNTTQKLY